MHRKRNDWIRRALPVVACVCLGTSGVFISAALAGEKAVARVARIQTNTLEVTSLCNSSKIKSSSRRGKTTYSCEGKKPTHRPSAAGKLKAQGSGGVKAEINCNYSESGGAMAWLGCTCTANNDGNCTNFITWCAEQGDQVGGNSGSASCSPSTEP